MDRDARDEQLTRLLTELPDEAPPPELDRKALAVMMTAGVTEAGEVSPAPTAASGLPMWMRIPWLRVAAPVAACALAAALLWPRPDPPPIILLEGSQLVEGHMMVLAGPLPVRVDGKVLLTVEPSGMSPRDMGQEVNMRGRDILAGALAGVAISVVVYEGKAVFEPEGEEPVTVEQGKSATWTAPGVPAASAERRTHRRSPPAYRPPPSSPADDPDEEATADGEADDPAEDEDSWALERDGDAEEEAERFPTSEEGINDAIREELSEIRECYQAWLNLEPDLEGQIEVTFVISDVDGVGEVTSTELQDRTTTDHTLFEGCVLNVMSDLRFEAPADGGEVVVNYPFIFKAG